jgi:type II secretion system protein C
MQKNSNTLLFGVIFKLLILLVVAKVLTLALLWFLPMQGIVYKEQKNFQPPFYRYTSKAMFQETSLQTNPSQNVQNSNSSVSITNMILKALYGNEEHGVVVVATKSNPKESQIIGIGEAFMGYKLIGISLNNASFEKGGVKFILEMQKSDMKYQPILENKKTFIANMPVSISKNDINNYAQNPKQIWKDIAISEVKTDGKITGFKVTRINPKSRFAELGLEKDDIIIKANNIALTSYQEAINIYQKIDTLESVQITFLRNNQEQEIVYEIH